MGGGDGPHGKVNVVPNAIQMYAEKWLKWQILCCVYFITTYKIKYF